MKIEVKQIVSNLQEQIINDVENLKNKGIFPKLSVILATDDLSALSYAKSKQKVSQSLGINYEIIEISKEKTEIDILKLIAILNKDTNNHGILIEFPLRNGLNSSLIQNSIYPIKDVDGLTAQNLGLITMNQEENAILPATPQACIELASSVIRLNGTRIALIGRGRTVGRPLGEMLINRDATVTICHSKTENIKKTIEDCEIVFVAIGKANFINYSHLSDNQIVIDAGINYNGNKLVGDVDTEVYPKLKGYSTVPGGVGSLTSTIVFKNLIKAINLQIKK